MDISVTIKEDIVNQSLKLMRKNIYKLLSMAKSEVSNLLKLIVLIKYKQ